MQQIYRQSDEPFEVFTTVISPQVCRSRTRWKHVEAEKVMVVIPYQSLKLQELDLNQGDLVQVLFKQDEIRWFGRLRDGTEGFFPAACVEPLQGSDSPTPRRRGSIPNVMATASAPCGCSSGHDTPKLLRKNSLLQPLGLPSPPPHSSSPSLLHRVLAKSRRKSCPHLPHMPPHNRSMNTGSTNTGYQPE